MTASPIVLTSRTGGSTTSRVRPKSRSATEPRSSGAICSPRRVKPTRSANATAWSRDHLALDHVAQVLAEHLHDHRPGERHDLADRERVALGELELGRARLEHGLEHHGAHRLGGGRQAAPQHAGRCDLLLRGQPEVAEGLRGARGGEVDVGQLDRVAVGQRQAVGAAQLRQEVGVGAGQLGDLAGGVLRDAADLALGGEEDEQPAAVRPAQLVVAEALGDQPLQQPVALLALLV
jgi:hypothetical protein